jgi:hypothetical protein
MYRIKKNKCKKEWHAYGHQIFLDKKNYLHIVQLVEQGSGVVHILQNIHTSQFHKAVSSEVQI